MLTRVNPSPAEGIIMRLESAIAYMLRYASRPIAGEKALLNLHPLSFWHCFAQSYSWLNGTDIPTSLCLVDTLLKWKRPLNGPLVYLLFSQVSHDAILDFTVARIYQGWYFCLAGLSCCPQCRAPTSHHQPLLQPYVTSQRTPGA